ncbi:hypothetical protein PAF15_06645 [Weissella koreensis]|uniref:hypothetical protein n=1 Tax=Weissella koreensis TaxID=165096 RepID=UPI0022BA3E24|nr:hypothetical protein [Weissella koreensis]MCZ9311617.1 hypothetical protein [Weissella koreensis]
MKKTLSRHNKERVRTIKANIARLNIVIEELADDLEINPATIYGTFRGRYTDETTSDTLSTIETYLRYRLGVRYIEPYFDDLD